MLVEAHFNRRIPGLVFLRGDSAAILVVLRCQGRKYLVLTSQLRISQGNVPQLEIPAGMLDGDTAQAAAVKELREETQLEFPVRPLGKTPVGMSIGACDERMWFFVAEQEVTPALLADLQGRHTGEPDSSEQITLKVVPFAFAHLPPDAKAYTAWAMYHQPGDK
jgi:ADP-sugar diphosphatase